MIFRGWFRVTGDGAYQAYAAYSFIRIFWHFQWVWSDAHKKNVWRMAPGSSFAGPWDAALQLIRQFLVALRPRNHGTQKMGIGKLQVRPPALQNRQPDLEMRIRNNTARIWRHP
jgi:hypothetical protein